jgi:hypothetical protein
MPILYTNVRTVHATAQGGGLPFAHHAPHAGLAVVGLRIGHGLSRVRAIFAELGDDGSMGPDLDERGLFATVLGAHVVRVEPGCVLTGLQVRGARYVHALRLQQTPWDGTLQSHASSWLPWWSRRLSWRPTERLRCHAEPKGNAVVIGIAGRGDLFVRELSLITATPERVRSDAAAPRAPSLFEVAAQDGNPAAAGAEGGGPIVPAHAVTGAGVARPARAVVGE